MALLEVCVDSIEGLEHAQASGAQRIELCSRLDLGGLSPDGELLDRALAISKVPLHVMVRPRAGDFVVTPEELSRMAREIDDLRARRVAGVVFGVLTEDARVDRARTRALVDRAGPLSVTFHRAFDEVSDLLEDLDTLVAVDVDRVLTSGGAKSALEGVAMLAKLVVRAADRIIVMPGGGVRVHNARQILDATGARELHSSTAFSIDRSA